MKTSEVLNRAADLIEKRGWATGVGWTDLLTSTGPLCIQGALGAAMGVDNAVGWRCPAYFAVADYIGIKSELFNWNDRLPNGPGGGWVGGSQETGMEYGRQQVIATLRAAALIEAAKENPTARILGNHPNPRPGHKPADGAAASGRRG